MLLWAQVVGGDALTPWMSLTLQAGAFGLLVYIVVRLYPSEAKEARDERERRETRLQAITNVYAETMQEVVDKLQRGFEDRNSKVVAALEKQTERMEAALKESGNVIEGAVLRMGYGDNEPRRK